jgi:polar amino acid transport system substrate-binding protein
MDFLRRIFELFSTEKYMEMIFKGLGTTLSITIVATIIGLVLGIIVAFVSIAPKSKMMSIFKAICKVYVTIIRGTPMALQLFIMVFIVFAIRGFPRELTAIIAFGINSGAYVAENIRAGILSVDIGQTEAGRALGLPYKATMLKIVIPQAIKNVIPAIGNELIALIKETSIVSMIGMYDLTNASKIIGSGNNMASYLIPMTVVALFYLAIVYALTLGIKIIEKRLRAGDKKHIEEVKSR